MNDLPIAEVVPPDQPLDIQHDTDPSPDYGIAKRIPHLGHAFLFFSLAGAAIVVSFGIFAAVVTTLRHITLETLARDYLTASLVVQGFAYLLALYLASLLFPQLWHKSFLHGIQWNVLAAHRHWRWIIPSGIALNAVAQTAIHFIPTPKHAPVDNLMTSVHGAWVMAIVAVILAPLMEEIAFRGFLLPALATAYDWLALERTPAGLERWQRSTVHSTAAVVFGAVFSSIPFALMHATQISYAWGVVAVLFGVSLALSYVRIRTYSVACSFLMHMTYNLCIFVLIFVSTSGFQHLERLHN
jgi:membrane protease YdiL (CAAX protease family)